MKKTKTLRKNTKGISATVVLVAIVSVAAIIGGFAYWNWTSTHYGIGIGQVGIVTDQVGGVLRVQKGPLGWAEKATWETVVYYDVSVQTEEMLSPAETSPNGTTIVHPEPLGTKHGYEKNLRYGAIPCQTNDGADVFVDASVQWHIDADKSDWEDRIKELYREYKGNEEYRTKTILQAVRDAVRSFATKFTVDRLVYKERETFVNSVTDYVQSFLNDLTTLHNAVVVDRVFIRRTVPPIQIQVAYLRVLEAQKQAESILIIANATREASIRVAEGQSIAIEFVINATSESVQRLVAQGLNATEAIQYLGLQYTFDSLKKIAEAHPDWKLTIFINSPNLVYTIPVQP